MHQKRIFLICLSLILGFSFSHAQESASNSWWRDTVWYQVFVRSFYDSDGDGIGDLRGLIEKLDYLNDGDPATTYDLGITGLWLMPINDAASYHGYDATDYRTVHPDFGTNEDFLALMDAAHARGIRVIVDLVLNHTSSQHPWFTASLTGNPDYADWYIWSESDPGYAGPWGAQAWWQRGGRYYYGIFWSEMPDLNYENPAVTAEMFDTAAFWIDDMGADGFRLDAIKYLLEDQAENGALILQHAPVNRAWLAQFNDYLKQINPEVVTVGEVLDTTLSVVRYVNDGAVDLAFEFDLAEDLLSSVLSGNNRNVSRMFERGLRDYPPNQFATFLTNHDQPRLMTVFGGDEGKNRVAATILLTTPGSPFIYYGEEIGMTGGKPDPRIRTPMQWDATPITAGFTTATTPYEPLSETLEGANVAIQVDDTASLLSHYRALIHVRHAHAALRQGTMQVMDRAPRPIFAYLRSDDMGTYLVMVNLSGEVVTDYGLDLETSTLSAVSEAVLIYGDQVAAQTPIMVPTLNETGGFAGYAPLAELAPYASVVIQLR